MCKEAQLIQFSSKWCSFRSMIPFILPNRAHLKAERTLSSRIPQEIKYFCSSFLFSQFPWWFSSTSSPFLMRSKWYFDGKHKKRDSCSMVSLCPPNSHPLGTPEARMENDSQKIRECKEWLFCWCNLPGEAWHFHFPLLTFCLSLCSFLVGVWRTLLHEQKAHFECYWIADELCINTCCTCCFKFFFF